MFTTHASNSVSDGEESDGPTIQSTKEMQRMKKQLKDFEEENNLLKYKVELLLDMVIITISDKLLSPNNESLRSISIEFMQFQIFICILFLLLQIAVSNSDMDAMQNELEKLREFKDKIEAKSAKR